MAAAYSTLSLADFWALPDYRLTGHLTERVEESFYRRCPPEERPAFIRESDGGDLSEPCLGGVDASLQSLQSAETQRNAEAQPAEKASASRANEDICENVPNLEGEPKKHDANLTIALHNVFWLQWWIAGIFKLISGMRKLARVYSDHFS